jgi:hypothetical protein
VRRTIDVFKRGHHAVADGLHNDTAVRMHDVEQQPKMLSHRRVGTRITDAFVHRGAADEVRKGNHHLPNFDALIDRGRFGAEQVAEQTELVDVDGGRCIALVRAVDNLHAHRFVVGVFESKPDVASACDMRHRSRRERQRDRDGAVARVARNAQVDGARRAGDLDAIAAGVEGNDDI